MDLVKQFSPSFLISGSAPRPAPVNLESVLTKSQEVVEDWVYNNIPEGKAVRVPDVVRILEAGSSEEIAAVMGRLAKKGKLFELNRDLLGNPTYFRKKS